MKYEILQKEAYPAVKFTLEEGDKIKAESDAVIGMSANVELEGELDGNIGTAIGRKIAGEKFFFQTLTPKSGNGEVLVAPYWPGQIAEIDLDGSCDYLVQKDGFLAGTMGIEVHPNIQNLLKGLFSRQGFFILKIKGSGKLFVNAVGAILPITLKEGEEYVVDNGRLVAWPGTMKYELSKASKGWISSFISGEMIVCKLKGPGTFYIQTRSANVFVKQLFDFEQLYYMNNN